MNRARHILGLDPALGATGWGVVALGSGRLVHVAHGLVRTPAGLPTAERLAMLDRALGDVLGGHAGCEVAVEEIFQNLNPRTTILLAQARGVALAAAARAGSPVHELAARFVKKAVTGSGRAEKAQVAEMVRRLLPGAGSPGPDEADALAVAIACAHAMPAARAA